MARSLLSLLCIAITMAWAKIPDFAKDASKVSGNVMTTVCSGSGPSIESARRVAINSCQQTAADFLANDIKIKSLIIQTEKDSAVHSESTYLVKAKDLTCKPSKEDIQESDEFFQVYLKCDFNLNKARAVTLNEGDPKGPAKGHNISDSKKSISISTVPICDDILITGNAARVIKCTANPVTLVLAKEDQNIILRRKNKKPIEKLISDLLASESESFNFVFDN